MKKILQTLLIVLIIFTCTSAKGTTSPEKKLYFPVMISSAPDIDGMLDDDAWMQGEWESDFIQFEPHNGRLPSQRTEFSILYDSDYLYVGIRAFDTAPDSIVKRLTRRDYDDGDFVGIGIDSYFDLRTAFIMGVTAGGTRFDFIMSNDGDDEDSTWDPNWWARSTVVSNGWEAEMRIPLSQLRFKKNGNGTWGIQVFRRIHRNGEMSFWQHTPADAPGLVHRFAEMKGMENLQPRRILDVTPYMVTSTEGYQKEAQNPFRPGRENQFKAGIDSKIGITNDFTLDFTINPDFGQVEADPSEVNLTAFESYFQEKRPFFIEGRNISSFGLGLGDGGLGNDNLFYSRRIGRRPAGSLDLSDDAYANRPLFTNIIGAAKLTGKTQSGLSVAIIESVTEEANAEIDILGERSFNTIEPLTNYFIARVQQDFNNGNRMLGGMVTSTLRRLDENLTTQMHEQAYSGGLDFTQYFDNKNWMLNINTAMSHVSGSTEAILRTQRAPARYFQRPDATHLSIDSTRTSLTGSAGRIQLVKTGDGHWNMMGAVVWKSPSFEVNDLGFMRESDNIIPVLWVQYRQWEPRSFYRRWNINGNYFTVMNFSGRNIENGVNANGFIEFSNFWNFNTGIEYIYGVESKTMLRGGPSMKLPNQYYLWGGISSDNRKKLILNASVTLNEGMDNSSLMRRISAGLVYKPAENINFSFNPSWTKSFEQLQYVDQLPYLEDTRYIFASLDQDVVNFSFRINYSITPDLTIQYWGQPFIAAGNYHDYKHITSSMAPKYSERFSLYTPSQINLDDDEYLIDENGDALTDYQFEKPDFKVREFLSNLVIRWEFNPGSSVYLVWNQTRSIFDSGGRMNYFPDLDNMFSEKPHNIFLLKFSWRFGLRG